MITSGRAVELIDAHAPGQPFVKAMLYRDYPSTQLDVIEEEWASARVEAAQIGHATGLAPLEHAHWDWRYKADSVEAHRHMLVAVAYEDQVQGLMAVLRTPRPAQIGAGHVVYVDYVEVAPWNLRAGASLSPRFQLVGTVLIADAVRLSMEENLGGRIGLHSLPQAEGFYTRCGMIKIGPDPSYSDLTYFEFTSQQAADWLAEVGESL